MADCGPAIITESGVIVQDRALQASDSTMTAIPWPPPMHALAMPYRAPRRRSSRRSVSTSRVPLAANGWPSAIAPPFTLVLSRGSFRIFSTARYCAANASFTSIKSICSSLSPASASAFWMAGTGPMPMICGGTPAVAQPTMRPSGLHPRSFAIFACVRSESRERQRLLHGGHRADAHDLRRNSSGGPADDASERLPSAFFRDFCMCDDNRSRPVNNATGVACGHDTFLAKRGWKRLQNRHRRVGPPVIIFGDNDGLLAFLHFHRNDFVFHAAILYGRFGSLLTAQGILIACGTSDSLLGSKIFRRFGHAETAIRIVESRHQRILKLSFAQTKSGARAANHMRALRHIFHAASQDELRFPQQNALRGLGDRFHA